MKICKQCGAEVADNASFCAKCGAKMEATGNAGGAGNTGNMGNAGANMNQGQYQPVSYTHLTLPTTSRRQRQMCIRDSSITRRR